MLKNRTLILVFVGIAGAFAGTLYLNYLTRSEVGQALRAAQEEAQSEKDKALRLESQLASERLTKSQDLAAARTRADLLRAQYATEKAALEILQQRFETAHNRGGPDPSLLERLEAQKRGYQDAITELNAQLKTLKGRETDLGKRGKIAKDQQHFGNQKQKGELEGRIEQQRALIRDTDQELQGMRKQSPSVEARARIELLKRQLKDQKAGLEDLKSQRSALSTQTGMDAATLDGQLQGQRSQLVLSREQIETRLRSEQSSLDAVQQQISEAKQSLSGEKSDYSQLQRDYRTQRDRVASIKNELDQLEKRLTRP